jgi:hypothetical protein
MDDNQKQKIEDALEGCAAIDKNSENSQYNFTGNIEIGDDGLINVDGNVYRYDSSPLVKFGHVTGNFHITASDHSDLTDAPRRIGSISSPDIGLAVLHSITSLKNHPVECSLMTLNYNPELPLLSLFKIKNLRTVRFITDTVHNYKDLPSLLPISDLIMQYLPMGVRGIPVVAMHLHELGWGDHAAF